MTTDAKAAEATAASPAAVRLENINQVFESQSGPTTALENINLTIQPGEFVSLIGPSGCGKSTLLRIVGDLIQPTSGTVEVNGKPAHDARIGALMDGHGVRRILTLNPHDFRRFAGVEATTPAEFIVDADNAGGTDAPV